ncbi:MAG: metalloregulator ArsR/SmtB family transcription factor [Ardenticatenaceae bacterium]|nr:metalloregulator ArsR/SmtB family transcription factor [Ardenticatenaceae bacterium]
MVIDNPQLDRIFGALSDATRRGILAQLSQGETNITSLAAPYKMSQPAISKHMRVLEKAGLIKRVQRGREHIIQANPAAAEQARDWIDYYAQFWREQFDDVEAYLKQTGELK